MENNFGFTQLAKKRYSSRQYEQKQVEIEKIMELLEAGRIAPSACNLQPWHFIIVREPGNLEEIYKTYPRVWFREAKTIIIVCGDHNVSWKRGDGKDHCDIDTAIAIDHITLKATELGLATCWVCNFDADKLMKIINLPEGIEPIAMLPVGYPGDEADLNRHSLKRKQFNEIVHFEKF